MANKRAEREIEIIEGVSSSGGSSHASQQNSNPKTKADFARFGMELIE